MGALAEARGDLAFRIRAPEQGLRAFNRMLVREPGVERIWKNLLQKVHYASAKPQNTRVRPVVPTQPDWFQVTRLAVDAGPELVQLVDDTADIREAKGDARGDLLRGVCRGVGGRR